MILSIVIVFGFCTNAFAYTSPLGYSSAEINDLIAQGYTDYRECEGRKGLKSFEKPIAQFGIKVGEREVLSPSDTDLQVTTPVATMNAGETVKIINHSKPFDIAATFNGFDFQYRIVPEGQDRLSVPITYKVFRKWSEVETQFNEAVKKMEGMKNNAFLELYLNVSDGPIAEYSSLPESEIEKMRNWSDNGNSATSKKSTDFPDGITWYFSAMVIEYKVGGPDFYPTPEGETEWKESFKESAKAYTGKPGEQITFPVNLYNIGTKGTTDFRAVWGGQGNDPEKGWKGSNPPWQTSPVELEQNNNQAFSVTVTFPAPGQPNKLYFMANIDGNTPANETNKDNNIMVIVFKNPGVDLAITGKPQSAIVKLPQTSTQMAGVVIYTITRKDGGTDPVQATLTMNGPSGSKNETITVTDKPLTRSYVHKTNKPGTYSFSAEVWPTTETEVYPPDNKTQTSIQFTRDAIPDPGKQDEDKNLEVGLTG